MKIEDLPRSGIVALGVLGMAGLAAAALAGVAVGMAVSRDPEALKRNARNLARQAARGVEQASLLAAQAREHIGDLWAEAREEALAEVDAADFARATAAASASAAAPSAVKRARRKPAPAASGTTAGDTTRAKPRKRARAATPAPSVDSDAAAGAGPSAAA